MMFPALKRHTDEEPVRRPTPRIPAWLMNLGYPVREGRIVDDTPGDANLREAAMRRRNGGPGVVPGGVRKHNPRIIDVQREYTLESDCLRRFYEEMGGDEWGEHASWQKLLMQLRTPDGEPIELNRVANMSSSEITHFRNELDGLRSKWVDKKVLPPLLTRVVEIRMPSNNLVGPLPDCLSELTYLRHLVLPENRLTGPIPNFLGTQLLELRDVDLSFNSLTGTMPSFGLRFISFLKTIRLHDNNIGGSLNLLMGNLTELTVLACHNNRIGGPIPESMTNCKKLEEVTFHNNRLAKGIPNAFGQFMPKLRILTLSRNRLTGYIPVESLACCSHLMIVNLDGNRFDFDDAEQGTRDQVLDYLKARMGKTSICAV